MSTSQRSDSPLVRFFDSFLQEKNIKWVLASGLLILLGSSLMMVTKGWSGFDPTIKFMVIMGYTAALFTAGQWSYHQLALRKTGTVLMALTVLMIPATFVGWHWLWSSVDATATQGIAIVLLGLNGLLAAFASQRIFAHLLRGNQTTFVLSFLLLSFSAAAAPAVRELAPCWSWLSSFVLWSVFAVGVIKVNRHVFWLTEEHRQPRIFGFFPIVLLGMQFLLVFTTNFVQTIPTDWLGLALVLVAIPVLGTADRVARVFQERTGNLVRPIPWPIMLPLCVGLILCAAGLGLAASGMAGGVPYPLVPTAALVAILMGVAAHRADRPPFVWAMLACVVIAYNFSPVFFQELARAAIKQGAQAVNEARLPYAFYGLTYLPLILTVLAAATWTRVRGHRLFARPLRQFVAGLSVLLLAVAFGHLKALFPVSLLMTSLFAAMAVLLDDRRLALPGLAAFLIATGSAVPFAEHSWGIDVPASWDFALPLLGATLQLGAAPWLDRRIRTLGIPGNFMQGAAIVESPTLVFSFAATTLAAAVWVPRSFSAGHDVDLWPTLMIGVLLLTHSLIWTQKPTSWLCLGFVTAESLRLGWAADLTVWGMAELAACAGLVAWSISYGLERRPTWRISRAWADVAQWGALVVLSLATVTFAIPGLLLEIVDVPFSAIPRDPFWWTTCALLIVWCFDAARRLRQPVTACIGCLCLLLLEGGTVSHLTGRDGLDLLPLVWTLTALAAVPLIEYLRSVSAAMETRVVTVDAYRSLHAVLFPVDAIVRGLLLVVTGMSLVYYHGPILIASGVAITGLVGWAFARREPPRLLPMLLLCNWFVIVLLGQAASDVQHLIELVFVAPAHSTCLMTALAATSVLGWQLAARHRPPWRRAATIQIFALRAVAGLGVLATMLQPAVEPTHSALVAFAFLVTAASEFWLAVFRQDVRRCWSGLAVTTAGFAFLGWCDVLHFGSGMAMVLPLLVGGGLTLAAVLARRHPRTELLATPFSSVGLQMPLMTAVVAVARHLNQGHDVVWHGFNSLALLGSSGFYFWRAVEQRRKRYAVLSAAILNVALLLLFRELRLSDPQFYLVPIGISIVALVEMLKPEIPTAWHNPLRYAGALVILVSPTFHLVGQSWLPMLSLMVLSTGVMLVAIGLRVRALMYTGTAFLIADLLAMVVRSGIEHPNLLWIAGIGFGGAILMLGAFLENSREKMLQRLRALSAQLEQWS